MGWRNSRVVRTTREEELQLWDITFREYVTASIGPASRVVFEKGTMRPDLGAYEFNAYTSIDHDAVEWICWHFDTFSNPSGTGSIRLIDASPVRLLSSSYKNYNRYDLERSGSWYGPTAALVNQIENVTYTSGTLDDYVTYALTVPNSGGIVWETIHAPDTGRVQITISTASQQISSEYMRISQDTYSRFYVDTLSERYHDMTLNRHILALGVPSGTYDVQIRSISDQTYPGFYDRGMHAFDSFLPGSILSGTFFPKDGAVAFIPENENHEYECRVTSSGSAVTGSLARVGGYHGSESSAYRLSVKIEGVDITSAVTSSANPYGARWTTLQAVIAHAVDLYLPGTTTQWATLEITGSFDPNGYKCTIARQTTTPVFIQEENVAMLSALSEDQGGYSRVRIDVNPPSFAASPEIFRVGIVTPTIDDTFYPTQNVGSFIYNDAQAVAVFVKNATDLAKYNDNIATLGHWKLQDQRTGHIKDYRCWIQLPTSSYESVEANNYSSASFQYGAVTSPTNGGLIEFFEGRNIVVTTEPSNATRQWLTVDGIISAESFGSIDMTKQLIFLIDSTASEEAFGTPTLIIDQMIDPSGITSAEAFGTPISIDDYVIDSSAISSNEAFGDPEVIIDQMIDPSGIASEEAFGTLNVRQSIDNTGIISGEAFGSGVSAILNIQNVNIDSGEAFGTSEFIRISRVTGIESAEAFGTHSLLAHIDHTAIASAEAFGTFTTRLSIDSSGIESGETFGNVQITAYDPPAPGTTIIESAGAIETGFASGTPRLDLAFDVSAWDDVAVFGTPTIQVNVFASAINSEEAFGSPSIAAHIDVSEIASSESFGTPRMVVTIDGQQFSDTEEFGSPIVLSLITSFDINSAEAFGAPTLDLLLTSNTINSQETFGSLTMTMRWDVTGIETGESFGTPNVIGLIGPTAITSDEAFGVTQIDQRINATDTVLTLAGSLATVSGFSEGQNITVDANTLSFTAVSASVSQVVVPIRINVTDTSTFGSSTTQNLPATSHTTGNFLIAFIGWEDTGDLTSVTDTAGNTYTLQPQVNHVNARAVLAYAKNITGNANNVVTLTWSVAPAFSEATVVEYHEVDPVSPIDSYTVVTGSGTTIAAGPVTPAQDGTMLFAGSKVYNVVDFSNWGDFTELSDLRTLATAELASRDQTSKSVSATTTIGDNWITILAGIKADQTTDFTVIHQEFSLGLSAGSPTVTQGAAPPQFVQAFSSLESSITASPASSGWTNVTAGNRLFAWLYTGDQGSGGNTGDPSTPSGWSFVTSYLAQSRFECFVYTKIADGTETGVTITLTSACECSLAAGEWQGLDDIVTTPVYASSNNTVGPSTGTTPETGDLALAAYWANIFVDPWVAGSGWTERLGSSTGTGRNRVFVQDRLTPSAAHLSSTLTTGTGGFQGGMLFVYAAATAALSIEATSTTLSLTAGAPRIDPQMIIIDSNTLLFAAGSAVVSRGGVVEDATAGLLSMSAGVATVLYSQAIIADTNTLSLTAGSPVIGTAISDAIVPTARQYIWDPGFISVTDGPASRTVYNDNGSGLTTLSLTTDGSGDNLTAINNALSAAHTAYLASGASHAARTIQEVVLPAGTIRCAGTVVVPGSGVVLRGQGMQTTRLCIDTSGETALRMGRVNFGNPETGDGPWLLTANASKGDYTFQVSNADGNNILVGDIMVIDEEYDETYQWMGGAGAAGWYGRRQPSGDTNGPAIRATPPGGDTDPTYRRFVTHMVQILSKSSDASNTTFLIDMPLPFDFRTSYYAEVWHGATEYSATRTTKNGTQWSGVEDLYITGGNVRMMKTAYCWMENVEIDGDPRTVNDGTYTNTRGITENNLNMFYAYRCEIKRCYIHHSRNIAQNSGAYLLNIANYSSRNYIYDNIVVYGNKPITANVCGGGNVIAYNYVDYAATNLNGWQEGAIDLCHNAFTHYFLVEGNNSTNATADSTHGNSGFHVFFRNYLRGDNSGNAMYGTASLTLNVYSQYTNGDTQYMRAGGCDGYSRETTYIGNVMFAGTTGSGESRQYQISTDGVSGTPSRHPRWTWPAVWRIGDGTNGGGDQWDDGSDYAADWDPPALATALSLTYRDYNWDNVTNSVLRATGAAEPLPPSLYLSGAPDFFSGYTWPPVNPDGASTATRYTGIPAYDRYIALLSGNQSVSWASTTLSLTAGSATLTGGAGETQGIVFAANTLSFTAVSASVTITGTQPITATSTTFSLTAGAPTVSIESGVTGFVQSRGGSGTGTTASATFATTASVNSLLLAAIYGGDISDPTVPPIASMPGWSTAASLRANNRQWGWLFYKMATGNETTITASFDSSANWHMAILEEGGISTSSPLGAVFSASFSDSTGTLGPTSVASEAGDICFGFYWRNIFTNAWRVGNGYTAVASSSATQPRSFIQRKVSTGSVDTSMVYLDDGGGFHGGILAVFNSMFGAQTVTATTNTLSLTAGSPVIGPDYILNDALSLPLTAPEPRLFRPGIVENSAATLSLTAGEPEISGDVELAILPSEYQRGGWNPGLLPLGGIPTDRTTYADFGSLGTLTLDGTGDQGPTINSMITSASNAYIAAGDGVIREVLLPAGTIRFTTPIVLRTGVVLRGVDSGSAGPFRNSQTRLRFDAGPSATAIRFGINASSTFASALGPWRLSADATVGSYTIQVSSSVDNSIVVGDILCIDEEDDLTYVRIGDAIFEKRQPTADQHGPALRTAGAWRSVTSMIQVLSKSVDANTLTLTLRDPIRMNFRTSQLAEIFQIATRDDGRTGLSSLGAVHWAGLENLYATGGFISTNNVAFCWVKNVELDGFEGTSNTGSYTNAGGFGSANPSRGLNFFHAYRCEARGNYIHHTRNIAAGGGGYIVSLSSYTSETLFEDNIVNWGNKPVVMNMAGGGNVIAYNYVDNARTNHASWQESCIDACHQSFTHTALFEGNRASNIGGDTTHGNSGWHVFFRNYATGENSDPLYGAYPYTSGAPDGQFMKAFDMQSGSIYYCAIGNVLEAGVGNGDPAVYEISQPAGTTFAQWSDPCIWRLGDDGGFNLKPETRDTLYRHNNWDSVTNGVGDAVGANSASMPPSLFRATKPTFFSDLTWPWVYYSGSTEAERLYSLPAYLRFVSGTY